MRVLVVDDSAVMRRAISQIIESEPGLELVGTARNGREGVEKVLALRPDAVSLDIEMPELDGLGALRRIMAECPTPVLMCSNLTSEGSHAALLALRLGAVDFVAKEPQDATAGTSGFAASFLKRLRPLRAARVSGRHGPVRESPSCEPPTFRAHQFEAVLIGSSTGGPPALEEIIEALPGDQCAPIVIAQHMPLLFTRSMAERLSRIGKSVVSLGANGALLECGHVYVCPGGSQTRVMRDARGRLGLSVSSEPAGALYKPSVDELFSSGASVLGSRALGVVLTGMGEDGLAGARAIRGRGGVILAQDAASCVVYGMPRAVSEAGLAAASLPPSRIGALLSRLQGGRVVAAA